MNNDILHQAYDPEQFRQQGHQLVDRLADYLAQMQQGSTLAVLPWQSPEDKLHAWQADFDNSPQPTINQFFDQVLMESIHIHHPRYVGHQVATPAPAAALAGLLSAFLNNGMAVYEMGPVSSAIERLVMKQIAAKVGYDSLGGGIMTSGGTLANLTALLAARQAKTNGEAWQKGTRGQLALMVSEEAHYCVDRAVKIMGWGETGMIRVPVNDYYQIRTDQLTPYFQQARKEGKKVIAVVASACSTSTGSYDNLDEIARFCQQYDLWMHVDGAHGAAAAFSDKYRSQVAGLSQADSITLDFHKMLMTPALTTGLLFKNERLSFDTFSQRASYLLNEDEEDWSNSGKRTVECTKRMMSIQVYALLRTYGWKLWDENITRLYDLANNFASMIQQHPAIELAITPQANIICFRYAPFGVPMAQLNTLNAQIRQQVIEEGKFYIVQTQLKGEVFLRVTLMNPFTTEAMLEELLNDVRQKGNALNC
ncbi:pyridoxal phosphate-dependent decarboxylase family protein [Tunicatimonas pelagia]|uniref:pyridoxal phosphate-dependent decarboxylase family protein n=1 Tax=Tunicatimonas pelagia TaxID=931531 RepID=UPI0026657AFC|nr:pyridoxal-dependent decarboxylase [Tunicatimonas pelagia]WKN41286.1 pyridoxal-dependent decarboxylase [Tunicatimonas pelagia]